jgi:hypothetical protein
MSSCIQAGIFVESVRANRTATAYFDNAEMVNYLKSDETFTDLTISDEQAVQSRIELYPNPAQGQVMIYIPENECQVNYSIFDISGRQLDQSNFTGSDATISIRQLQPGVYVLRFEMDGEIMTNRLVVM